MEQALLARLGELEKLSEKDKASVCRPYAGEPYIGELLRKPQNGPVGFRISATYPSARVQLPLAQPTRNFFGTVTGWTGSPNEFQDSSPGPARFLPLRKSKT